VPADHFVLAQLLSLAGLVAGTAEYSTMIRRRADRRRQLLEQQAAESAGLHGLVRVFLADSLAPHGRE
jgi:hypothetical protein